LNVAFNGLETCVIELRDVEHSARNLTNFYLESIVSNHGRFTSLAAISRILFQKN